MNGHRSLSAWSAISVASASIQGNWLPLSTKLMWSCWKRTVVNWCICTRTTVLIEILWERSRRWCQNWRYAVCVFERWQLTVVCTFSIHLVSRTLHPALLLRAYRSWRRGLIIWPSQLMNCSDVWTVLKDWWLSLHKLTISDHGSGVRLTLEVTVNYLVCHHWVQFCSGTHCLYRSRRSSLVSSLVVLCWWMK